MLVIGICDGDTAVRVMLSKFIRQYREETGLGVQVLSYDDGEKLLRHYPFEMDLIFLEIPFARMNGIEIARRIRLVDPKVGIVFLTSILNCVLEAYEVRADNYLIKPLRYGRFLKEVELARARQGENRFFMENNANGIYKIYTKSIRYIETENRNTRIHTETDSILSYKPLKEHEENLFEPHFIRCHTGYIVNLLFFEKLESGDIVLQSQIQPKALGNHSTAGGFSGERIPVSRQRRAAVLARIRDLYGEVKL